MLHFLTTPIPHGPGFADKMALYIAASTVVFVAILALIHPTSSQFKKRLTMFLAFLAGGYYLVEFMLPAKFHVFGFFGPVVQNRFTDYLEPIGNAQQIWLALALVLGVVNLFRVNGRLVARRRPGWHNGVVFFLGFFGMLTFGMLDYYKPGSAAAQAQVHGWYTNVFFEGFFNSLGATSFSLLAFYIVSAAYRSFRVRSPEAILLLVSALIMMLGLTPLGTAYITGFIPVNSTHTILGINVTSFKLEIITEWILIVLNGAAQRALLFGVAVGLLATSLRIWLSLERGQFFEAEM